MVRIRPRFSNLLWKLEKFFRKVPNFDPISQLSLSSVVKNSKFAQNRNKRKVQRSNMKVVVLQVKSKKKSKIFFGLQMLELRSLSAKNAKFLNFAKIFSLI